MNRAWETFDSAPIVEAVLDLRIESSQPIEVHTLAECFLDTHPHREEIVEGSAQLRLSNAGWATSGSHRLNGYRFWAPDRTRLAQARLNGFTVNHLRPYKSWAALIADGRSLWQAYCRLCAPSAVVRIALRYVNRIAVPRDVHSQDYLNIGVRLAGSLEQHIPIDERTYQLQVTYEDAQRRGRGIVRAHSEPPSAPDEPSAHILDIDVFRVGSFSPQGDDVWSTLDELRDMKNELFFAATTDKAQETFRR